MHRAGGEAGGIAIGVPETGNGTDVVRGTTETYSAMIGGIGATTFGADFTTTIIDTTGIAGIAPTEDAK